MPTIEIRNRNGAVIHTVHDVPDLRAAVEKLVRDHADLAGAYLAGANLYRTDLAGVSLAEANLAGAHLAEANLAGAYLAGANLYRTDLAGVSLAGAYLAGAKSLSDSHDAASEILRRAATTAEQERWAMWVLAHRDWCWETWAGKLAEAPPEIRTWARAALLADNAWGFAEHLPGEPGPKSGEGAPAPSPEASAPEGVGTAAPALTIRPAVLWFAERMEERLRANDAKDGWEDEETEYLLGRLSEEAAELYVVVDKETPVSSDIICEAADTANFAMMIAHNAAGNPEPPAPASPGPPPSPRRVEAERDVARAACVEMAAESLREAAGGKEART